ncbi:MAG: STAS domain-containing protein [Chloroflexi bacterium]|nr:STAS domain-containing protein [Chloroflexota bacterium]
MEIAVRAVYGRVPITVLTPYGSIDGSTYRLLIAAAEDVVAEGCEALLLDLSEVDYVSTAGLVALQSIAQLMRGEARADDAHGWDAIHSIDRDRDEGKQPGVRLLNPQENVARSLDMVGLAAYFHIYHDEAEAVEAF